MKLAFDADDLRPLIQAVVQEVLEQRARLETTARLAYTEPEAAELLGLRRHVLRDSRLRGEIEAAQVGKRILYSKEALLKFLSRQTV